MGWVSEAYRLHTDDHVVKVRVEVLAFGHVDAVRGGVVVAREDVVDVVEASRAEADLGEVRGPGAAVHVLGVVLREVVGVDAIVDVPRTFLPLLVVVLLEVVVARRDREDVKHFLRNHRLRPVRSVYILCPRPRRTFWP